MSFIAEFNARFERLADAPLIGRRRDELGAGVRFILHGRFLIFYRPTEATLDIVRVLHGRRDLSRGLH